MAPTDSDDAAIDKIIFLLFTNAVTLFEILILKAKSPVVIHNANTPIHSVTEDVRFPPIPPPPFICSSEGLSEEIFSL